MNGLKHVRDAVRNWASSDSDVRCLTDLLIGPSAVF